MNKIFDYTYYRIAKKYFKRDGSQSITALLTLTLIMSLYILFLFFAVLFSFFEVPDRDNTPVWEKAIVLTIMFLIFLYNKKRYNNMYFVFRERWINESKTLKIRNGILVIFFIISPLILIVILAAFFNKLNL
ncbi:hypothetical protein [Flavobacterium olei]|uniref:hypothetical protein n=1 Tax=Flavobacterium olei TaxID=1886782 RepID=UPI00321A2D78